MGDEEIVQAAGAREPDFVSGVEQGDEVAQEVARVVERDRLQEGLRRQAGPAAEQVMEMRCGKSDMSGDLVE